MDVLTHHIQNIQHIPLINNDEDSYCGRPRMYWGATLHMPRNNGTKLIQTFIAVRMFNK